MPWSLSPNRRRAEGTGRSLTSANCEAEFDRYLDSFRTLGGFERSFHRGTRTDGFPVYKCIKAKLVSMRRKRGTYFECRCFILTHGKGIEEKNSESTLSCLRWSAILQISERRIPVCLVTKSLTQYQIPLFFISRRCFIAARATEQI